MNPSITVIKLGGNALNDDSIIPFCQSISQLKNQGIVPIIIHGGGPQINHYLKQLNIEDHFINGLRYTDQQTLSIVEMVLSGQVNKHIVNCLNQNGLYAVGISGKDANLLTAKKHIQNTQGKSVDMGWVGEITKVDLSLIHLLINHHFIPVIAPIATGESGETYNINADFCATEIAKSIAADKLIFMTDIDGLLDKKQQLITEISANQAIQMIDKGIISGGMIPKIQSAIDALDSVSSVHIINGKTPKQLTNLLLTQSAKIGTTLIN